MSVNVNRKSLRIAFFITLVATLLAPAALPSLKLNYFAPFLVIVYYQKELPVCLWISLICGLIIDLISSHSLLGIHALVFTATTWILYNEKRHFFADSITTLPIMTFFFSILSTLIQAPLYYIFESKIPLAWQWAMTDLIIMPAADALFAFAVFILPALAMGKRPRRGTDYFQ